LKIALTGSTGFLGKELLSILNDKKFNVKCYSLRNKEKIKLFLNDVSKVKYNVIINSAASINPITKNDFYINKYLPKNILSSIKDLIQPNLFT
jgi:dTDP-4-dehydrorhamnose reductase